MDINAGLAEVNRLLKERFGLDLSEVDENEVRQFLLNGEEPEAIVDGIKEDYDLTEIDLNPFRGGKQKPFSIDPWADKPKKNKPLDPWSKKPKDHGGKRGENFN